MLKLAARCQMCCGKILDDEKTDKVLDDCKAEHSTDHAVWKALFFGISMPSVIGLQMSKNQMPLSRGSLALNLGKNSFFNPLAFIVLALWPSKVAK